MHDGHCGCGCGGGGKGDGRTARPRFLVIRGGAIGDFIVTLPVLQALRARWPECHIALWAYPHVAQLAVMAGLADEVTSLDRADMARFFVPVPEYTDEQRRLIPSFDIVFNYLHDIEGQVRSNLLLAGARQVLSGSPMIKRPPATRFLLEPLMDLALYDQPDVPVLAFPEAILAQGRARLAAVAGDGVRPVVVHPGAGAASKRWGLDGFLSVADRVEAAGGMVAWALGEADGEVSAALAQARPGAKRLEGLELAELAPMLAAARAYLGNDSGVSHVAAAVGVPTLALFGPTDPETWAPKSRAPAKVLAAPDGRLEKLGPEAVWAAFRALAGL